MKRFGAFLIVAFVLAGIASLGGWLYSRETLFRVSTIEVQVDNEDLERELEESLFAYSGRSMFSLKLREVESLLLKNPEVSSARIRRVWPGSLVVEIVLKNKAALEFRKRTLWFIDEKGIAIAPLDRAVALPLVWGFDKAPLVKEDVLSWLFASRPKDELLQRLDEVYFDQDVILGFRRVGLRVNLGNRNWAKRWARAKAAFAAMQKQGRLALFLDASIDGRVFVYDSVELHNSQSGLNLNELVRRTRDVRAKAR